MQNFEILCRIRKHVNSAQDRIASPVKKQHCNSNDFTRREATRRRLLNSDALASHFTPVGHGRCAGFNP